MGKAEAEKAYIEAEKVLEEAEVLVKEAQNKVNKAVETRENARGALEETWKAYQNSK